MALEIGRMLHQLRKKVGVSQHDLRRGLLSVSELSRIENGEKIPDSFLMAALMQRLGKSMTCFDLTVTGIEYERILLRVLIQNSMINKRFEEAEEYLQKYESLPKSKRPLHKQYTSMVYSVLNYLKDGNKEACLERLQETLSISFSADINDTWGECCFDLQEIQIMILIAYMQLECGKSQGTIGMLRRLLDYIESRFTSEEVKVAVYSKCCYLLAKNIVEEGDLEQAYEICGRGLDCLIENGSLYFIRELLEIRQMCHPEEIVDKELEAIRFLNEFTEFRIPEEVILRLLFFGESQEIILCSDFLKEMRTVQGWTQEDLCDGVCARETLSNIENGRKPNQKKMDELLQKLGVNRKKIFGFVMTEDVETYEMVRDYKRNVFHKRLGDNEQILSELEKKLDLSIPANRQFIEASHVMNKLRSKVLNTEEGIAALEECLYYTMPEYDGTIYRVPTREEFNILNNIALCRKRQGNLKRALQMYSELYEKYRESQVTLNHHIYSLMLLYLNYGATLEESERLEEAEVLSKEGIELMLKCSRGDMAALVLGNLACVYEKFHTQASTLTCKKCCRYSYYLLNLYRLDKDCAVMKRYYEETFQSWN